MEEEQRQGDAPRKRRRRKKHGKGGGNNQPQNAQNNAQNAQNASRQQQQPQGRGNAQPKGGNGQNGQKPTGQNAQGKANQNGQKKQPEQKQPQPHPKKNKNQTADKRPDTFAYALDGNLYLNLTNKCSNGCDFCVRNERESYFGHELWIRHGDPSAEKVIAAIEKAGELSSFKEVVFCGFGEPTYRMEEMVAVCDYLHEKGAKTRLNTNGQGNLINKRDIVPELKGKIDLVNISLNAPDKESYQKICRSMFKESGFEAMIEFAKSVKRAGIACRFSVVDCIGEEQVEACKKLCAGLGIPLYIRKYISES